MYWSKVKTALIALFALINIFLVITIIYNSAKDRKEERRMIESAVSVLQKNNIEVSVDQVPEKTEKMKVIAVQSYTYDKQELAKKLVGAETAVETRGAYSRFEDGERSLSVKNNLFYFEDKSSSPVQVDEQTVKSTTGQLADLGFDMTDVYTKVSSGEIEYTALLDGREIFANNLRVVPGQNGPASIGGSWITVIQGEEKKFEVSPAYIALLNFLRDDDRPTNRPVKITAIELGYSVMLGIAEVDYITADAVPTWRIEINNGIDFFYDARPM